MPTITATYAVSDTDTVLVDVVIGDGQPGGSTIRLGSSHVADGGDRLSNIALGQGSAIRGKVLVIASEARDENPDTDRTSVTVTIRGGAGPADFAQSQTTAAKGEIISYVAVITFTGLGTA